MKSDRQRAAHRAAAFTLMEIMVVVAIIGLCAAMSVPAILQMRREGPMRKAVNDVLELCSRARAGAVNKDTTAKLEFHPHDRQIDLMGGDANMALTTRLGQHPIMSTQFDPSVTIQDLTVDLKNCTDAEEADVNFHDNGTCDEMTLILSCDGEREMITLELTTSLPTIKQL
jgi:prepilin-type N-terminal cleavage/methylation domain-containing protein